MASGFDGGEGIVVIESDGSLDDVIAINYAYSVNADVVLVPPVDRNELHKLPRQLHEWSNDRSSRAFDEPKRKVTKRIRGIDFSVYRFATFYTVGLPYGLVTKNIVPSSHFMKGPPSGVFIVNCIVGEHDPVIFDSALIFSPQLFESEETGDIAKMLNVNNYAVKLLLGACPSIGHFLL